MALDPTMGGWHVVIGQTGGLVSEQTSASEARGYLRKAQQLWRQYRSQDGNRPSLETEAISLVRQGIECAGRSGDRALDGMGRLSLGTMLIARYETTGDVADLENSAQALDSALVLLPSGHEDVPQVLATVASVALHRFMRSGDPVLLSDAVAKAQQGIEACRDVNDARLAGWYSNLGSLLRVRHEVADDRSDIDRAVECGRLAVERTPSRHQPLVLGALIGSLIQRGLRYDDLDDVGAVAALARQTLSLIPKGYAARGQVLGAVVAALRVDHQLAGSRRSLDEAIPLQRELVASLSPTRPDMAIHLSSLSELLRLRFEQLGSRADLDEAVAAARRADEAGWAAGQPAAARSLSLRALAQVLLDEGREEGSAAASTESVDAARRARKAAEGHPVLVPRALILEGNGWLSRHAATQDPAALEQAIGCFEQAAEHFPDDDAQRGVLISNAAVVRLNALPDDADASALTPVIDELRRALAITGSRTARGAQTAANLGAALSRRYVDTQQTSDLREVCELWDVVAGLDAAPPQQRVRIAGLAGELLMLSGQHGDAADRYADAVRLLPMAAWRGADRAGIEAQLAQARHLACDAAASRLAADGDGMAALRVLEAGRGVMWTRLLQLRRGGSDLEQWNPQLAARLGEIAAQLERIEDFDELRAAVSQSGLTDRRALLAAEYRELADRAIAAGHGGFLAPPDEQQLLNAAVGGPVVVVNVSQWRCDALIVSAAGVHPLRLTALSVEEAEQRTADYLHALGQLDTARALLYQARRTRAAKPGLASARAEDAARSHLAQATQHADALLDEMLRWLWDTVAQPVIGELERLGLLAAPQQEGAVPRLWWCLTGALSLLPVQAAGHHDVPAAQEVPRTLLDRFICSSIPTVQALAQAHRSAQDPAGETVGEGNMIMVALPETPGHPSLPEVHQEQELLRTLFAQDRLHILQGGAATRSAVREALHGHRWAHVSCHGTQDLDNPSRGGLLLCDGLLSVPEISSGRHRGDFIMLSACKTVTGGRHLPDEAISLGAAVHFTGYRHVIGTQWSVGSRAAADFCESLYTELATEEGFSPAQSAAAVRKAALRLRADASLPRYSWTPFVHIGP
ncbi:CHAT domain-containing protein [Streptomyces sp. NPDC058614]|uniref:CHAT domain-containing protein n=1 Tax=Streptomyces sp. NPDC058614 TaxID=3346557 RepID=UPI003655FC72